MQHPRQHPTLLKPSDLTKSLLKSPSNYCDNEGSKGTVSSSRKISPSPVRAILILEEEKRPDDPASVYENNLKTPPQGEAFGIGMKQPINPISQSESSEWLPEPGRGEDGLLLEHTVGQESRLDGGCHEIPDVLKQLVLSESKLKQNEKVLKEFQEHRSIAEQICAQDYNANGDILHDVREESRFEVSNNCSQKNELDSAVDVSSMENLTCLNFVGPTTPTETAAEEEISSMDISTSITCTRQESDTSNDAAIAAALQEELRKEENKNQVCKRHMPQELGTMPNAKKHEANDYELALKIQEGFDKEMANMIQSEEKELHRNGQSYRKQQLQGHLLQSGASEFQQSDRELDRERRLRYLERESQQRLAAEFHPPVARNDSIELSYEELYELEDVPNGYDPATIERHTSTFHFTKEISRPHSESEHKKCLICLTDYDVGNFLRLLPCMHSFHCECIDTWLSEKKNCPVCLSDLT